MISLARLAPHFARGWQIHTESPKAIAITFDDGPDPVTTPWLLTVLDQLQLRATMFVVGRKCRGQATLLREIATAGHAIACHGYVHTRHGFRTQDFLDTSLQQSRYLLDEFGIKMSPAFRPPYGFIDFSLHNKTRRAGFAPILWSAHIGDWKPQSEHSLRAKTETAVHERMIFLLHDGHESTRNLRPSLEFLRDEIQRNKWTTALLPESISTVRPA